MKVLETVRLLKFYYTSIVILIDLRMNKKGRVVV